MDNCTGQQKPRTVVTKFLAEWRGGVPGLGESGGRGKNWWEEGREEEDGSDPGVGCGRWPQLDPNTLPEPESLTWGLIVSAPAFELVKILVAPNPLLASCQPPAPVYLLLLAPCTAPASSFSRTVLPGMLQIVS